MQHYSKKTDPMDQRLYLAQRIDRADARLRRLNEALADAAARELCARWITAWAVAAGADAPRGMKLRIRGEFILL
ncbi:hypothetical protein [Janthinobacterium sp. RB2P8]|uniref:hypothetical protein n=1 Tax=Janthinobacterium sp. RB2P8 TaxID=3424191 RepID=UPI003F27D755